MPSDVPATTDLYVEPADLAAITGRADSGAADIALACESASRAVDELASGGGGEIQRRFWLSEAATERIYTAKTSGLVVIDDAADISAVTSDGAVVTDFLAEPKNAAAFNRPFTRLEADPYTFSTDRGAIVVTAVWGWPEVPSQVAEMATILASKLLQAPAGSANSAAEEQRAGPFWTKRGTALAIKLAKDDPEVQTLLGPLVRFPVAVA
jgi:hypothetical protein